MTTRYSDHGGKGDDHTMLDPGDILDPTMTEAKRVLDEMRTTKDLDKRKAQSEILLNLCQSVGVFFDLMADAIGADGFPDPDDDETLDVPDWGDAPK